MTYRGPAVPQVRQAGVAVAQNIVLDVRTVVMPASYAAGGHPVDLSAAYSSVVAIQVLRGYVTATKAPSGRLFAVNETGTDTYANRKFRVQINNPFAGFTPAGTVSAPGTTTDADVLKATGAADNRNAVTQVAAGGTCTVAGVGCNGVGHTDNISTDANHIRASGVSKVTAVLTVTAPTFTGTAQGALASSELAAGTDASSITVEYLVIGVPA